MTDQIGAPSFSLGFDFDTDTQPPDPTHESDPVVVDSDPDTGPEAPRILRRLRRASGAHSGNVVKEEDQPGPSGGKEGDHEDDDDDIEDFSQEEDEGLLRVAQPSSVPRSVCSSSKVPFKANGVLTPQASTQWIGKNRTLVSDAIPSESLVPACNNKSPQVFKQWIGKNTTQIPDAVPSVSSVLGCNKSKRPKLAVSPLRMFQLIDSDSDDSVGEDRDADLIGDFSKASGQSFCQNSTVNDKKGAKESNSDDLWKDFPIKRSHVSTPAFDEVFNEYFHTEKNKNMAHNTLNSVSSGIHDLVYPSTNYSQNSRHEWNLSDSVPPAHDYFLHNDLRVQNLVRSRLPNFLPLGISNNQGNMRTSTSAINYMSQFGSGESSKREKNVNSRAYGNSMTARNKRKKKQNEEDSKASGDWVNPKSGGTLPKDAGKRRVHADGQSAGHWFTDSNGKRVYVAKNGQELTGQVAYRHYRKESGAGFKKSRKGTGSKKKRGKG